jgi:hypothetical protein
MDDKKFEQLDLWNQYWYNLEHTKESLGAVASAILVLAKVIQNIAYYYFKKKN